LLSFVADAPVVKLVNQILSEAVKARSSDILIEPFEKKTRIRYRIDGILRPIQTFPSVLHTAVVSRFKVMSNLDIAEQRLPQDGRFQIEDGKKLVDFRISVLPSSFGEKVALRILDRSAVVLDIESLGFTAKALADLKESIERPHGMILICGPTGSGKTTTLYSLLMLSSSPEDNVVTVEDPIEYQIEGLNQVCARPDLGLTFASVLRSILRQDPDTIMIGEVRDYETADIAIKSALTGHLLLTTLHATTATGAIVRLMNMGVEPFLISASVILTAAQRLVRRICPKCREPYTLDGAAALNAGFKKKEPLTLDRGRGCGSCSNTGYKGRVGLMETVVSTAEIRQLIASRADEHSIREAAIKSGMVTLRDDGLAKVLTGATTLEEVLRVTAGEQDLATRLD
ncbi:MAG: GspE/PulE family protein, partial [Candidatus Omnitrophota bacterium]